MAIKGRVSDHFSNVCQGEWKFKPGHMVDTSVSDLCQLIKEPVID